MEELSTFTEQLVTRDSQPIDVFKKFVIVGGSAALALMLFMLGLLISNWLFIFWMLGCAVIYLGYRLFIAQHVEYEYIVTGNELDIDKIIAQHKRERLITVKITKFKRFCKSEEYELSDNDSTVVLAYGEDCDDWCADVEHEKIGNVRLCFSPDKKTLRAINQALPARLKLDLDSDDEE